MGGEEVSGFCGSRKAALCACVNCVNPGAFFFGSGLRPPKKKQVQGGGDPHEEEDSIRVSSGGQCPGPDDGSLAETYGRPTSCGHAVVMQLLLGRQSWPQRAPFCYSIRSRVERKKRSSPAPLPPRGAMLRTPPAGQKCSCQL